MANLIARMAVHMDYIERNLEDVQLIRAEHDAILTGGNTVRNDQPRMNARVDFALNQPKKILLTSQNEWNRDMDFFQTSEVDLIAEKNLHKVINNIAQQDINSVLVEAGPKLVRAFLKEDLCEELIEYKSPNNLGDASVPWFEDNEGIDKFNFNLKSSYTIDRDLKYFYKMNKDEIKDVIADLKKGKMVIILDDEDRENEGDLICAAEAITPEIVNFMATNGRGLICLALDSEKCEKLNLRPMTNNNKASNRTAFTVSIEAKDGITTGISAKG